MQVSRREVVGRLMVTSGVVAGGYGLISNDRPLMAATAISWPSRSTRWSRFDVMCEVLARNVDDETCDRFLRVLHFEGYDGAVLTVSVPVEFNDIWISEVLADELLVAARSGGYRSAARVDVKRRPLGWKSPEDPVSSA